MKRREFIERSGMATGAAVLGKTILHDNTFAGTTSSAGSRGGKARIKLGLYTISYLGIWYDGPALSFEEICKRAKDYGYEGIELDNKRPMGNPMDLDQRKRDNIKNLLAKYSLEIPCVAANNDFSSPVPEHRECQLLMVKETASLAKDLGAPFVRLFAAWPGVPIHNGIGTYDLVRGEHYTFQSQFPFSTWIERWNFVKEALKETAGFAEEFGVVMVLQNHEPLFQTWKDCYDMVEEVNSPWLKVCLDLPIMEKKNKEYVENAVRTVGKLQVHSHYGGEYKRDEKGKVVPKLYFNKFGKEEADYRHYISMMNEISYQGYFTFELCHPVWDDNHQPGKIEYVHDQVQLAAEYMRNILSAASL